MITTERRKNNRLASLIFAGILLLLLGIMSLSPVNLHAQPAKEQPDIVVQVQGLSCPFCAYGLEKKLKSIKGVNSVYVGLNKGVAKIKLKNSAQPPSKKKLKKAVKNAGFKLSSFSKYPDVTADNT